MLNPAKISRISEHIATTGKRHILTMRREVMLSLTEIGLKVVTVHQTKKKNLIKNRICVRI